MRVRTWALSLSLSLSLSHVNSFQFLVRILGFPLLGHLEQLYLSVFILDKVWNWSSELVTVTFSISVPWTLTILVFLTHMVGTASQNTRRREKCISVILDIMRIYKTCNSVVVMSTFSIHNLLKCNTIMIVCVCTYIEWQIFVCIISLILEPQI